MTEFIMTPMGAVLWWVLWLAVFGVIWEVIASMTIYIKNRNKRGKNQ